MSKTVTSFSDPLQKQCKRQLEKITLEYNVRENNTAFPTKFSPLYHNKYDFTTA